MWLKRERDRERAFEVLCLEGEDDFLVSCSEKLEEKVLLVFRSQVTLSFLNSKVSFTYTIVEQATTSRFVSATSRLIDVVVVVASLSLLLLLLLM